MTGPAGTATGTGPARARTPSRPAGWAFGLVLAASLYVLFAPDPAGADVGPPGMDKLVHLTLFALLAGTARWRFGRSRRVLAAVWVYAALSEVVQGLWLAHRSGDPLDLVADTAGLLVGWLLAGRRGR